MNFWIPLRRHLWVAVFLLSYEFAHAPLAHHFAFLTIHPSLHHFLSNKLPASTGGRIYPGERSSFTRAFSPSQSSARSADGRTLSSGVRWDEVKVAFVCCGLSSWPSFSQREGFHFVACSTSLPSSHPHNFWTLSGNHNSTLAGAVSS